MSSADEELSVQWVGSDNTQHWVTPSYAREILRLFYDEWPGGVEEFVAWKAKQSQGVQVVGEIRIEPDYWSRGHFFEGTRKKLVAIADIEALPVGTKLYVIPPDAGVASSDNAALIAADSDELLYQRTRGVKTPDERMRHDYPILQQFHSKHALGALAAPSCLCCGHQTGPDRPIAVQHLELPAIVVCKLCKDASGVALPRGTSDKPVTGEQDGR